MRKQKWLILKDYNWHIVIPDVDIKPHSKDDDELSFMDCPCRPKVDYINKVIIHNSFLDIERINKSLKNLHIFS